MQKKVACRKVVVIFQRKLLVVDISTLSDTCCLRKRFKYTSTDDHPLSVFIRLLPLVKNSIVVR